MALSELLNLLREWQSGIGALLGFTLGAWINFSLNRRRDKAQRKEEMVSIAIAIYGEISSVRLKREEIQLVALDAIVGFAFDSRNRVIDHHFFEERH
jgi:hypothetical protein